MREEIRRINGFTGAAQEDSKGSVLGLKQTTFDTSAEALVSEASARPPGGSNQAPGSGPPPPPLTSPRHLRHLRDLGDSGKGAD